jgi:hypothetical protein
VASTSAGKLSLRDICWYDGAIQSARLTLTIQIWTLLTGMKDNLIQNALVKVRAVCAELVMRKATNWKRSTVVTGGYRIRLGP